MNRYRGAPWRFEAPEGASRLYIAGGTGDAAKTADYGIEDGGATVPAAVTAEWPAGLVVCQWLRHDGSIEGGERFEALPSIKTDGAEGAAPTYAERMVAKYEAAVEQAAKATTDVTAGELELAFAETRRLRRELARWRRVVARQRAHLVTVGQQREP